MAKYYYTTLEETPPFTPTTRAAKRAGRFRRKTVWILMSSHWTGNTAKSAAFSSFESGVP